MFTVYCLYRQQHISVQYNITLQTLLQVSVPLHHLQGDLVLCLLKLQNVINFPPTRQTQQNRTFQFHIQPVPQFINNTDFTTQRPTALYRIHFNIL